jgi:hypothetical protein
MSFHVFVPELSYDTLVMGIAEQLRGYVEGMHVQTGTTISSAFGFCGHLCCFY